MKEKLIEFVLKYGIIKTDFRKPITFKSGIQSPIYCNFRECSSHLDLMEIIRHCFEEILTNATPEVIIGVATGGISHATLLASELGLPSGYIRPGSQAKDYGLKNLIEGAEVSGKNAVLIEDLVSTGGSVINNAEILKKAGATEITICSIFSYEMERSKKEFAEAGFVLWPLITVNDVLPFLKKTLSENDYASLEDWTRDPEGWFGRHKLEFDFGFLTELRQSAQETKSNICMGLDPVLDALPEGYKEHGIIGFQKFLSDLFAEMKAKKILPAMFKPNLPWWLRHDDPRDFNYLGSSALADTMDMIKNLFQSIPINIDCKSGDIGTSSGNWAEYIYDKWMANAMTVHSYMGSDSVNPFLAYCNNEKKRGAYLLVKTTNKGAIDLQMRKMVDGRFVYEVSAENVISWAKGKPGTGAVTAGNSPAELAILGKIFAGKDIPLLIPGVGKAQGGDAGEVIAILNETGYEKELIRINLSSGLTHPWYKIGEPNPPINECVDIVIETLRKLNEQVLLA